MTNRTIDEILADLDRQYQQEAELSAYIATQRNQSTTIPVYTFFSTGRNLVAVVQDFGDKLRISRFSNVGAMGHLDVKDVTKIGYELRMEGFETEISTEAGALLESWVGTPEWERGNKQALFLAYWNTFSFMGRNDLYRQMDHAGSLDEAIGLNGRGWPLLVWVIKSWLLIWVN